MTAFWRSSTARMHGCCGEFSRLTPSADTGVLCSHEDEPPSTLPQAKKRNSGMNARKLWSRILIIVGGIAMLLGAIDPLEGSLLILPGSGSKGSVPNIDTDLAKNVSVPAVGKRSDLGRDGGAVLIRLINLVDATGTTKCTYYAGGLL